jgi:hypothetical protein
MSEYSASFTRWWDAYPRRVGKRKALTVWRQAIKRIAEEKELDADEAKAWLLKRTKAFANTDKGRSGRFCPYPETWLRQGRYDDDDSAWGENRVSWKDEPWTAH